MGTTLSDHQPGAGVDSAGAGAGAGDGAGDGASVNNAGARIDSAGADVDTECTTKKTIT